MKFNGIVPQHLLWIRCAAVAFGAFMIVENIRTGAWYCAPLGLLAILAAFFSKEHVISDEGVDVIYKIFGIVRHNLWTWDVVTSIHTDYEKAAPNVQVHIGREIVTRTFVFNYSDSQEILKFAAEKNPEIFIQDMNAEETERLARIAKQKREAARKAKEAKKAAKRKSI